MFKYWLFFRDTLKPSFILSVFLLASCAAQKSPTVTECVISPDQAATFKGHWTVHPIPLAIVANDFTATELAALQGAIDTWNTFYQISKGFKLFLSGTSDLATVSGGGSRITSASACSQSVIGPNGFTSKIMIYKTASGWTYGTQVMALTSLCPVATANSKYRMFVAAVMEVNFQNYFNPGQPIPDLQSIITHELGHMLGLDHACSGNTCATGVTDYSDTVMYPSLGFDGAYGRVKQALQQNDQERANCLY